MFESYSFGCCASSMYTSLRPRRPRPLLVPTNSPLQGTFQCDQYQRWNHHVCYQGYRGIAQCSIDQPNTVKDLEIKKYRTRPAVHDKWPLAKVIMRTYFPSEVEQSCSLFRHSPVWPSREVEVVHWPRLALEVTGMLHWLHNKTVDHEC